MSNGERTEPLVSVVIVHYRTPRLLERCLGSIQSASPDVPLEILIVDNSPEDDSAERLAARFGCRYLRNEQNVGYGRAINQGIEASSGKYLLILNPDIEVRRGSIERLTRFMEENPSVGICGPKLLNPDGTLQYSARRFYTLRVILLRRTFLGRIFPNSRAVRDHLMMDWDHADARDVDWLLGGAIMVRRAAVDEVGGMDERFFLYFEDVDWCNRMHKWGWRVVYVPEAEMVHDHQRASARGFLSKGLLIHLESGLRFMEKWAWILYLLKKHASTLRLIATVASDLLLLSVAFLAAYFTRYGLGLLFPSWGAAKPLFALNMYIRFLLFGDLVGLLTFHFLGLYKSEVWRDPWREMFQLAGGMFIVAVIVMASTFLFTTRPLSRFAILLYFPYGFVFVAAGRALLRRLVLGMRERKLQLRRLAVFGPRSQIEELKERFRRHGSFGYEPVYVAHEETGRGETADPVQWRIRLLRDERIAEVAVFDGGDADSLTGRLLDALLQTGLPISYVPPRERYVSEGVGLGDLMGFGAVRLGGRLGRGGGVAKQLLERAVAACLVLLLLPFHIGFKRRAGGVVTSKAAEPSGAEVLLPHYADEEGLPAWPRLLRYYPVLREVARGRLALVGAAPIAPGEWQSLPERYKKVGRGLRIGVVTACGTPLGFRLEAERAAACNALYSRRAGLVEDLRLLMKAASGCEGLQRGWWGE